MKPILEEKNIKNNINIAVQRLLDGNLVIVPTETVYGIGADATNSMAVKKIYHIKNRPFNNPIICHFKDLEKVKEHAELNDIALNSKNVCKDPEPRVRLRLLGESGLRIQLLFWIEKPELRGFVIDEITSEIYNSFNSENIDIPFPQRTLHIKKDT